MRALNAAATEASTGNTVRVAYLCRMGFPGGTVATTSGDRPVAWNGDTYQPDGAFSAFSSIQEDTQRQARTITFTLSAADSRIRSALSSGYNLAPVDLYVAFFVGDGSALLTDPIPLCDTLLMSVLRHRVVDGVVELDAETRDLLSLRNSSALSSTWSQSAAIPATRASTTPTTSRCARCTGRSLVRRRPISTARSAVIHWDYSADDRRSRI
jgi:hypothetical protein